MALKFARPIHPGEFLREEYLLPLGLSAGALAGKLNLPRTRIERIAKEEIGMTPDTALRLARYFNTTAEFWMNFQQAYELETEARKLATELDKIEPLDAAA
ncbi:MAG TPA: HigA family addiction module antitoxin [Mesorhizobium sp.]|jgi:addiction module HigA family antidote